MDSTSDNQSLINLITQKSQKEIPLNPKPQSLFKSILKKTEIKESGEFINFFSNKNNEFSEYRLIYQKKIIKIEKQTVEITSDDEYFKIDKIVEIIDNLLSGNIFNFFFCENLNELEKLILFKFISKKFKTEEKLFNEKEKTKANFFIIPQQKKKRNEEKYKFGLKLFLKYSSENSDIKKQNKDFSISFLKKKINLAILSEIAEHLHLSLDDLLKLSFISKRDFIICGFKKISLYNKSRIFSENFGNFIKNYLIKNYKKTRRSKIYTIIDNIISKVSLDFNIFKNNFIIDNFFDNKKIKMPWSDRELESTKEFCIRKLVD